MVTYRNGVLRTVEDLDKMSLMCDNNIPELAAERSH